MNKIINAFKFKNIKIVFKNGNLINKRKNLEIKMGKLSDIIIKIHFKNKCATKPKY